MELEKITLSKGIWCKKTNAAHSLSSEGPDSRSKYVGAYTGWIAEPGK